MSSVLNVNILHLKPFALQSINSASGFRFGFKSDILKVSSSLIPRSISTIFQTFKWRIYAPDQRVHTERDR